MKNFNWCYQVSSIWNPGIQKSLSVQFDAHIKDKRDTSQSDIPFEYCYELRWVFVTSFKHQATTFSPFCVSFLPLQLKHSPNSNLQFKPKWPKYPSHQSENGWWRPILCYWSYSDGFSYGKCLLNMLNLLPFDVVLKDVILIFRLETFTAWELSKVKT